MSGRCAGEALARRNSTGGTAEAARDLMNENGRAKTLEQIVLELVREQPGTGEELLERIRARGIRTVLYSVKPRLSTLKARGLIVDSGERGVSESGKLRSVRWRAATPDELSLYLARAAVEAEKEPVHG